jgi:hypothetical protein
VSIGLLGGAAYAQTCSAELAAVLGRSTTPEHVSGVEGVAVVRAAVELLEPALPRMRLGSPPGVAPGEPGFGDALYLYERNLLPEAWRADALARPVWQEIARRLLDWYRLDPLVVVDPSSEVAFVDDVSRVLEAASAAVRPAAIVAFDPDDRDTVAFWALMWNWTVFPRLIVFRPHDDVSLVDGVGAVLPHLGSCALQPTMYLTAPEATATRLFRNANASEMIIVGGAPNRERRWPYQVGVGAELAAFAFEHPEVADLELYSAVFVGPRVHPVTLLRLLPQVRTNLSPRALLRYLETP